MTLYRFIFPNFNPSVNKYSSINHQIEIEFIMAENQEQNIENEVQDHVEENCDQIEMKEESFHKAASAPTSSYLGFSNNETSIHEVSKWT